MNQIKCNQTNCQNTVDATKYQYLFDMIDRNTFPEQQGGKNHRIVYCEEHNKL